MDGPGLEGCCAIHVVTENSHSTHQMGKLTREVVVVVEGDALEIEGIPESEYECDATERCRYEGMAVDPQTMQATKRDGGVLWECMLSRQSCTSARPSVRRR